MRQGLLTPESQSQNCCDNPCEWVAIAKAMGTLYHNPRCSKSRQTLAIIRESGVECNVVEYLKHPLNAEQIKSLISRLRSDIRDIVRTNESEYKQSGFNPSSLDDVRAVSRLLEEFPKLMQRPVYDNGDEAVIGRPPESVKNLL